MFLANDSKEHRESVTSGVKLIKNHRFEIIEAAG